MNSDARQRNGMQYQYRMLVAARRRTPVGDLGIRKITYSHSFWEGRSQSERASDVTTFSGMPSKVPPHTTSHRSLLCRSEEHTSELQSRGHLVCRLLLEKK